MRSERRAVVFAELFSIYNWSRGRYGSSRIVKVTGIKRNKNFSPFCSKANEQKRFEKYCKEKI